MFSLAFLIKNIMEFNLLEGAKIVAGKNGINNEILWINLMEILDALDSLQKGELLVTTGYNLDNENQYGDIILKLKKRGLCGMAIQPGYYIDKIPEYIKEDADKYNFPIIELPPDLTFSHIMHVLLENVNLQMNMHDNSDFSNLRNKLANVVTSESDNYISRMFQTKQEPRVYFFLASISYSSDSGDDKIKNNTLLRGIDKIKSYFAGKCQEIEIEQYGKNVLFTVSLKNDVVFQDVIFDISNILNTIRQELNVNFLIGVSELKNVENLFKALNNAMVSQQALNKIDAKKGICTFNNIKLFKLFEIMHYSRYSVKFAHDILKPIIDYDIKHNSSYLETLKLYLVNECNINKTSSKLFIHRHTLKNRLNRIGELCKVDFKNYYSRLSFSIAIFIYDYFIA